MGDRTNERLSMVLSSLSAPRVAGVFLQVRTQQTQGGESPAFDGAGWDRENGRGFLDAQILSKAQAKYLALLNTQMCECLVQVVVSFPALKPFSRVWFAGLHSGHLSTQFDAASIGAGVIVASQVVSDGVEPGTEWAWIAIALCIAD